MSTVSNPSQEIKSISFFTDYGEDPCAHLRIRGPMRHLGIKVLDGKTENKINSKIISQSDMAVIQRDFPSDLQAYDKLLKIAHLEKKPVVFDLDDLLLLFPENHPERYSQKYIESLLPMIQVLYEVDMVTTTTSFLQNWLKHYIDHVTLLPNFLDDDLWQLREPVVKTDQNSPLIIGYMGSASHKPDIEYISPVLAKLINRFPKRLEIHFWGIKPPVKIANLAQVKWIPAVAYEYEDFAAYFQTQSADIFIAPLMDCPFNRAKSPLKFFEYTALGAPGVYSKLETFEQAITHTHDGLLASSLEEWEEYLIALIEDRDLRLRLANNAQQTIRDSWLLSKNAFRWHQAYKDIIKFDVSQHKPDNQNYTFIKSITQQYNYLHESRKNEILTQENRIIAQNEELSSIKNKIVSLSEELSCIKNSWGWKLVLKIRKIRDTFVPPGTKQALFLNTILQRIKDRQNRSLINKIEQQVHIDLNSDLGITNCQDIAQHSDSIDIIVCVHNALEDVQKCLESIIDNTNQPYHVILVDDGSDIVTKEFLASFSSLHNHIQLIRNEKALGYTRAANIGMKASDAPFFVLINSDTIVTPQWLDRLYRAISNDEKIGIVGPLSNTASWQSIPKLSENGDWAINELSHGVTVNDMGALIAKYSACVHHEVPLLNGFCLMIRKEVIDDIGLFDELNFGQGYGEEDDFVIRASEAGWKAVIVDDAYIFHAQSKSYTNSTRFALQKQSGQKLLNKHGADKIAEKVEFMNPNRVMEGIRARTRIMVAREQCLIQGNQNFKNKKVLFVLPVRDAGGGANVILDEAKCMQKMGVKVYIFNLSENKHIFSRNYSHFDLPFIFGQTKDLLNISVNYDALIASANYSVPWFEPLQDLKSDTELGYYIQDYEPLMYQEGTEGYYEAFNSYTMIRGIKRFTKTQWTKNEVLLHTGANCESIGISVNIDLFRPRDMNLLGAKPVKIVAMVRPSSYYRNPEITLAILKKVNKKYNKNVDIWIFGSDELQNIYDPDLLDFEWRNFGKLTQVQVAAMMSKADIFTDFSIHQAMGLTALEAMAAGCAVIVPQNGGAIEFVNHRYNGIVTDTSNFEASVAALDELIADDQFRKQIQINAINDVVQYYPEKPSYNILQTLFGD